jgi:hypothetical protein
MYFRDDNSYDRKMWHGVIEALDGDTWAEFVDQLNDKLGHDGK